MSKAPEEMFGEVVAYVEQARGMMARGEWVDLKGLDRQVREVCEAIGSLSREQAQEYLPELQFLQELVGELEQEMRGQQDAVREELKGAGTLQRATKAYTQGKVLTDKKD